MNAGMTVRGRVRGGRLRVDAPLDLPDDTEVELAVIVDEGDDLDAEEQRVITILAVWHTARGSGPPL